MTKSSFKIKAVAVLLVCMLLFTIFAACKGEGNDEMKEDTRTLTPQQRSILQLSSTDVYGRSFAEADAENEKQVGIFYFLWLGEHPENQLAVYDITKLLEEDPEAVFDPTLGVNSKSPVMQYHFWGEPLYGYYNTRDVWVMTKHVEMLTMAGIDFLVLDATNAVFYKTASILMMSVLDKYQKQGWDVPKVVFYTNSDSVQTMKSIYEAIYKQNLYPDLWYYRPGQTKPMIIGWEAGWAEEDLYIRDFFDLRLSQWPNEPMKQDGFPWIDFGYPQYNHNGTMSVSIAQHKGNIKMSTGDAGGNAGRGYLPYEMRNDTENMRQGSNFESQWQTVFDNYDAVDTVHITGWNEWIALKAVEKSDSSVFFVDTFNEEFSRDIEPMRGGYGDNFYLQMVRNIRKFKFDEKQEYILPQTSININIDDPAWENVKSVFKDFTGEVEPRNHVGYDRVTLYTDDSGRNDIDTISVTHDAENLYLRIETVQEITLHEEGDTGWMNVLIRCPNDKSQGWNGYHYILNRQPSANTTSLERLGADFSGEKVADVAYKIGGENYNVMFVSIPLSALGTDAENISVELKVADNVQKPDDIMDYYVTGDVAPIGRLNFKYGK